MPLGQKKPKTLKKKKRSNNVTNSIKTSKKNGLYKKILKKKKKESRGFTSGSQSIGVSVSTSVLIMNIQD